MSEQRILEYIANSTWQVPMLAAMAWLLGWLCQPSVKVQHRIWLLTLALSIFLPTLGKRALLAVEPSDAAAHSANIQLAAVANSADRPSLNGRPGFAAPSRNLASMPWFETRKLRLSQTAVDWLIAIYLIVILLRLMQLAFGLRSAQRLLTNARRRELSPAQQAMLKKCCTKLHVRQPQILTSDEIRSPMTVGGMRPTILLPETFDDHTACEMLAILCHELAHVRRRDYAANWTCQLGSLPIAYHPATYGVQRRIRRSRELVCDAMAAEAMSSATGYARCLVTLAQGMLAGADRMPPALGVGLFDHDVFEERIMRLVEKKDSMSLPAKVARAGCAMALVFAVIAAAAIFHITPTVVHAAEAKATVTIQIAGDAPSSVVPPLTLAKVVPAEAVPAQAVPAEIAPKAVTPVAVAPVRLRVPIRMTMPVPVKVRVRMKTRLPMVVRARIDTPIQIAVAVQTPNPKPAPNLQPAPERQPAPAQAPPLPPLPPLPQAPPLPKMPVKPQHRSETTIRHRETMDLTPAERARMERDMAAARLQMRETIKKLQSPEFKQQMADMRRQVQQATSQLRSEEVQRQMKMLQSPEFKKQMADMREQMREGTKQLRSAEIQSQMKYLQSPEFKQQMADMQRKVQEATKQLQSSQWQREMQDMQRQLNTMPEQNKKSESAPR